MGEADEIATQKVAAFALEFPTNREEPRIAGFQELGGRQKDRLYGILPR
jgi:hypothetical protein